jgi:hypothetical protein
MNRTNEYRALQDFHRTIYVVGVMDGWDAVGVFGTLAKEQQPPFVTSHTELYRCAIDRQMTKGQVRRLSISTLRTIPATGATAQRSWCSSP